MRNILNVLTLTSPQIIFIVVVAVLVAAIMIFVPCFIFYKKRIKKVYKERYYKKINSIALNNDYFLVNQFPLKLENDLKVSVDHILAAEKFIYVISDFYFEGDVQGKLFDQSFIFVGKKEQKQYVDNPVLFNKKVLTRLAIVTGLDITMLKGIVLVNDSCSISVNNNSEQFYIINRRSLNKFIKKSENNKELASINQEQLEMAINTLAKIKKKQ